MKNNIYGRFFIAVRGFVRIFRRPFQVQIKKHTQPVVYVSHHQNLFGPFHILLSFPIDLRCWMFHVFLEREACYQQYANYTFGERFGWNRTLAKIAAFFVSLFIPKLLNSGRGIPVYRGSRKILDTFKLSTKALNDGESLVIFPDVEYSDNSAIVKEMYDGFLYIEKYFYRETGKHVSFVPVYVSKNKKTIIDAEPIYFRDGEKFADEQEYVLKTIQDRLNTMAKECGDD